MNPRSPPQKKGLHQHNGSVMGVNGTIGALLIGSYLLGSLPIGLWIAKKVKGVDIRTLGSGNIGSTNVGRVCGPVAGTVVFTLDIFKGLLPPLLGARLHPDGVALASGWLVLAALLAIIGHNYSVWLGFQGGKGIATSAGALFGIAPPVGLSVLGVFLFELATIGYVSLGSILAALSLPFFMAYYYTGDRYRLAFALAASLMAVYKHRANVQRLRAGTEPKVHWPGGGKNDNPVESSSTAPLAPTEAVVGRTADSTAPAEDAVQGVVPHRDSDRRAADNENVENNKNDETVKDPAPHVRR